MVRLILAKAQTVDKTLPIFSEYSVIFGTFLGYPVVHYMIVDRRGNSAIGECVDNKLIVVKDAFNSRIMTNHFISKPEVGKKASFERYNTVKDNIDKIHAVEDVQNLLNKEDKAMIVIRPHIGYGYTGGETTSHYGLRLLLSATRTKRYGIEFTKFSNFYVAGIILEQRLFKWFNSSIGTVGYFYYGEDKSNVVGLTTNLGWEPDNHIPFKLFVTYRTDVVFKKSVELIDSISIGFNLEF